MDNFFNSYMKTFRKIFVCIAFAFLVAFSFGQSDLKQSFAYENNVIPYSDYIDLTGYKFAFNSTIQYPSNYVNDVNISSFYIDDDPDYLFEGFFFSSFDPGEGFLVYSLYYGTTQRATGVATTSMSFNMDSERYITIIDGECSSDFFQWFVDNSIITYPELGYNITINLDSGIYGETSATIQENSTLTLEYSVVDNDVFSGYVFDYGQNLITGVTGHGHISVNGNYEKITIIISDVTEDFEFTIHSVVGHTIVGQWYLDYNMYLSNDLQSIDIGDLLSFREFTSNGVAYDRIYRNENYNTLVYENTENFDLPVVNVFSFLSGLYLPVNTYNYLLIDIENSPNSLNYLPSSDIFFKFFRLATNEDRARVNQLNNQLIVQNENTNFISLFGAILDTQFGTLKSLLNFYIFDINLFSLFTFFLTLSLIFFVIKIIKGGRKDE